MGVKYKVFSVADVDKATIKAIQAYKEELLLLFDRYTLRDTGNLINSGTATDTERGFRVNYGADYARYVFHNPDITPTQPGTSSYWDEKAQESEEYAKIMKRVSQKVSDILNSKK